MIIKFRWKYIDSGFKYEIFEIKENMSMKNLFNYKLYENDYLTTHGSEWGGECKLHLDGKKDPTPYFLREFYKSEVYLSFIKKYQRDKKIKDITKEC